MPNESDNVKAAWGVGNLAFYRMCEEYPDHNDENVVKDKIVFISRVYSVARGLRGEWGPLTEAIVRKGEKLDHLIQQVRALRFPDGMETILSAHAFLDDITCKTLQKKGHDADGRASFASKYLHFHAPDAFPILDSFAFKTLKTRTPRFRTALSDPSPYARFCERLAHYISKEKRLQEMSLRHIDTELFLAGGKSAWSKR